MTLESLRDNKKLAQLQAGMNTDTYGHIMSLISRKLDQEHIQLREKLLLTIHLFA